MKKCLVKHSVKSFEIIVPFTIKVQFEDDTTQTINFESVVGHRMYWPLRDPEFFNRVFISDEIPTLTWPNGADFNPDHLYNWQKYEQLYIKRISEWEDIQSE